jgi:hypothetical protein
VRALTFSLLTVLLVTGRSPADAPPPKGKLVEDIWDAAYLQNGRAGFVHTTVTEFDQNGDKVYRTNVSLHLTVRRFKDTIQLRMDTGTDETEAGKVVGTFMRQFPSPTKQLTIAGRVAGKELRLTQDGTVALKPAPWDDRVVGLYRQQKIFQDRKVKPGDTFSYRSFEPSINLVVTQKVQVKDYENVELPGSKFKKRLLRVETRPEKIDSLQLPTITSWLDQELQPVRSQVEIPGLGLMVLQRTTKAGATSTGQVATLTDIGIGNFIKLSRRIPQPYATREVTYRVTVKGEDEPTTVFARDDRQQVRNPDRNTFELHVRASQGAPAAATGAKGPGDEFVQSSYFIKSDDAKVQELARRAVGAETDPWQKALRIEKWVHDHMRSKNDEAMATADHVARTLEGDCSEFAMLMAAMCRAAGVPSKTAVGLIYADTPGGPVFAFHMWTEVWVRGRWVALDATLGRGHVGATHLKITDHSWHEVRDMTPMLPLLRVLGKVSLEVVGVGG